MREEERKLRGVSRGGGEGWEERRGEDGQGQGQGAVW